ncbi:MAG: DUF5330 domain-containing protein [Neorhizobium sp.]|nr:DUF5330 domain-containing protein [Neorhizobium sp.]
MWFLIKAGMFFTAILVVLSFFSNQQPTAAYNMSQTLKVGDAITAATGAYQYVSSICQEKPEVCEKGASTFSFLGERAREGAKVAYDLIDQHFGAGSADKPSTDKVSNGKAATTAAADPVSAAIKAAGVAPGITVAGAARALTGDAGAAPQKSGLYMPIVIDPSYQPMPDKAGMDRALASAEDIHTGTIPSNIPLPTRRPIN